MLLPVCLLGERTRSVRALAAPEVPTIWGQGSDPVLLLLVQFVQMNGEQILSDLGCCPGKRWESATSPVIQLLLSCFKKDPPDVEESEPLYAFGGSVKWGHCLGNRQAAPQRAGHRHPRTQWPHPRDSPEGPANECAHEHLSMCVHSGIICNSLKVETTTRLSPNERVICSYPSRVGVCYLAVRRDTVLTCAVTRVNRDTMVGPKGSRSQKATGCPVPFT